ATSRVSVRELAGSVASLFQSRARRVAIGKPKAHVEYRALGAQALEALAAEHERLSATLERLGLVQVNPDVRRVTFSFDPDAATADELARLVEEAEQRVGAGEAPFVEDGRTHPADPHHALRHLVELAGDAAAF